MENVQSHFRNDNDRLIVSDLTSLIEHVQASMKLLEQAIASEASLGNQEASANVVVLDDVTPRYLEVNEALNACNARLSAALHLLRDINPPYRAANGFAADDRRSLIVHAQAPELALPSIGCRPTGSRIADTFSVGELRLR
jgi:hypothetical protein